MSDRPTPSLPRALGTLTATALVALFVVACGGPEYPNCNNDEDCREGEFCVNNLCQQCRSDDDCGTGERCNAGACEDIPGYCDDSRPCPSGQECVGNRCQEVQQAVVEPEPEPEPEPQMCQMQPVYFAFDSSDLDGDARGAIEANAQCMQERGVSQVRATGHADPRGTEEYNLALGDQRARSVQRQLGRLGVQRRDVETHSRGEQDARGYDEASWARDRRVEIAPR
jgi:peptidoglycan-associated lipoprotein